MLQARVVAVAMRGADADGSLPQVGGQPGFSSARLIGREEYGVVNDQVIVVVVAFAVGSSSADRGPTAVPR